MFTWLLQSFADQPVLVQGLAPEGMLSPSEAQRLDEFHIPKRRNEWLLGRWTAKKLIQSYIEQQTHIRPPLNTLVISNDPDGAPTFSLAAGWSRESPHGGPYRDLWARPNLHLSISHRGEYAFCALSHRRQTVIGADIERIEPRDWSFVEDFFTPNEATQIATAGSVGQDFVATLFWSAKEAVLKALRLGLTVDTRSVECLLPNTNPVASNNWHALQINASALLPTRGVNKRTSPLPPTFRARPRLEVIWRMIDGYVLTIALFTKM